MVFLFIVIVVNLKLSNFICIPLYHLLFPSQIARYTDINMEEFKCPIFLGCIICVTGLCGLDRRAVQQLTIKHGGQYMGQLKMNECTHLIVQEPKGKGV